MTESKDRSSVIMVAATLMEAAATDAQLAPLAQQAMKIVLDDDQAIAELLVAYKQSRQKPEPTPGDLMPSQIRAQKNNTTEIIGQLKQLIAKLQ